MTKTKLKIAHVFGGKPRGGVEATLHNLISCTDLDTIEPEVLSLSWGGRIGARIEDLGVKVRHLDLAMHAPENIQDNTNKAFVALSEIKPDIVHCWHYHGNYYGTKAAKQLAQCPPIIWRLSDERRYTETAQADLRDLLIRNAELSHQGPDYIICASKRVKDVYEDMRYNADAMHVHYNGVDTKKFTPDHCDQLKQEIRKELGLPQDVPLIAMAARFDTNKDQEGFIKAAQKLHALRPNVHFMLCGTGNEPQNEKLMGWVKEAGLAEGFHLIGERHDMERIYHAGDVWTLCSIHEAFANTLLEALACGKLCVATDTGMSYKTVGGIGEIIPSRNIKAPIEEWDKLLVEAWIKTLDKSPDDKQRASQAGRMRMLADYGLEEMADVYNGIYHKLNAHVKTHSR